MNVLGQNGHGPSYGTIYGAHCAHQAHHSMLEPSQPSQLASQSAKERNLTQAALLWRS